MSCLQLVKFSDFKFVVALLVLLVVTLAVYRSGLSGSFLFDDFSNLPALGNFGRVDNAKAFWLYVTSGTADPTGRPLALLSFLIDAQDWPADPYPFKRTNLILHLLNGALLTCLLIRLGKTMGMQSYRARVSALIAAGLWLLHPLFVSTTLYVVQREAMLPVTFTLLGLMGYIVGWQKARDGFRSGAYIAAGSIVLATSLAILSKANGILLPLLVLVVDAIILKPNERHDGRAPIGMRFVRIVFLGLPSAAIALYLAKTGYSGFVDGIADIRPWTLGERLLTEFRVLVDYLALLWLPRPFTAGLFNDSIVVSHGWFSPMTTLISAIVIASLLILAFFTRKRFPAITLAITFFFAAQLLESTVVPLELYFEHRNYLPALLMFWPLAISISPRAEQLTRAATGGAAASLKIAFSGVLLLGVAWMTYLDASLWGNTHDQAILWAIKNPTSSRARAFAAHVELVRGNANAAVSILEKAFASKPDDIQLALNWVGAKCAQGSLDSSDIDRAATSLRTTRDIGRLGYDWFSRGLESVSSHQCAALNENALNTLLRAASDNPNAQQIYGRRQDLLHLRGRLALLRGNSDEALRFFNAALDQDARPPIALEQAALLGSAKEPTLGLRHLAYFETVRKSDSPTHLNMASVHDWLLRRQGFWDNEIAHLRQTLQNDAAQMPPSTPSDPTSG